MSPTVLESQPCGHCKKEATHSCPGCHGARGYEKEQPVKTNYCNVVCQRADWESHKELCTRLQARKILYRAGDTIQKIFYLYQESKWARNTYRTARTENTLYQHEDEAIELCETLYLHEYPPFGTSFTLPFPNGLFPSDREKESALAHLSCHDSLISMHEVVSSMMQCMLRYSKGLKVLRSVPKELICHRDLLRD